MIKRSSKSSHLRSWNQQVSKILAGLTLKCHQTFKFSNIDKEGFLVATLYINIAMCDLGESFPLTDTSSLLFFFFFF